MKFKYIIIFFNILIIFVLSFVAVLPFAVFGMDMTAAFWQSAWPLALVLIASLAGLNSFFLMNRRLFMLLEREDWPALTEYLENKIYHKGYYASRHVRLLLNSYLVLSDFGGALQLENKVAIAKPALLDANAIIFGAARILGGDARAAADFFQLRLEKGKIKEAQWLRWYYGFSLVLARLFDRAEEEFRALVLSSNEPLITGLSAFFLSGTLLKYSVNQAECRSLAVKGRERVVKALKNGEGWKRQAARIETEVHAAIIKKYIDEAGAWLFKE
ncbi:MAG: hypothetical protein LBD18_07330 [Treponema sp.]|nr:hypothetical protein [Treponema sp.]